MIVVLVQINDMVQGSFINATLRWSAGSMSIPTNSIYDLNMTSVPQAAEKYFTVSNFISVIASQILASQRPV